MPILDLCLPNLVKHLNILMVLIMCEHCIPANVGPYQ